MNIALLRRGLAAAAALGLGALALADGIKWNANYADALSSAKTTGKLMFVDFYADW